MRSEKHFDRAPLLMDGMMSGARFSGTKFSDYIDIVDTKSDMQMSAVTYSLSDGSLYIAFRGTDRSIVGWKEDLNMSYLPETGGQRKAIEYLERVGSREKGPIRVGGHSKGGNLACYASAYCNSKIRDKIRDIYIYDGPGFEIDLSGDADMNSIIDRIHGFIPVSSVVGRLMYVPFPSEVVASVGNGIYQHDVYNWQVGPTGFDKAGGVNAFSDSVSGKINSWIQNIPKERRKEVIDELFAVFESVGIDHSDKFTRMNIKTMIGLLMGLRSLSADNIKLLVIIMKEVMAAH
jgi:hypothetical protein